MTGRTLTRVIAEVFGAALALLFAFAIVLIPERLFAQGENFYSFAVLCWPLALCYIAGRFLDIRNKKSTWQKHLAEIAAIAAALILICAQSPPSRIGEWIRLALLIIPAIILLHTGEICVPVYPMPLAVASVICYLAEIVFFRLAFSYAETIGPLTLCALFNFILTFYAANSRSMLDGLHVREEDRQGLPQGIRKKNTALLTGVIVVILLIGVTGIVQRILGAIGSGAAQVTGAFLRWMEALDFGGDGIIPTTEIGAAMEGGELSGAGDFALIIIIVVFGVIVLTGLISGITLGLKRLRKEYGGEQEEHEPDEMESLFSISELLRRGRGRMRESFKRKPGFDDMPTDELKIRFAYKALLDSPLGEGARQKTPLEVGSQLQGEADISKMSADYSAVRYGTISPAAEDVENARATVKRLKRLTKKKKQ